MLDAGCWVRDAGCTKHEAFSILLFHTFYRHTRLFCFQVVVYLFSRNRFAHRDGDNKLRIVIGYLMPGVASYEL